MSDNGLVESLGDIAERAGLTHIKIVAWRDLGDPEAGGSELHTDRIATRWADAGLDVEVQTSAVPGASSVIDRHGYKATRQSGRYAIFARTSLEGFFHRHRPGEGLVEVWNGMPFFSPLWYRGPRIAFLHHVHAEMWRMVLSAKLARLGYLIEHRIAPPIYRHTPIVTLSQSSKDEIVEMLGLRATRITVVPPGIEPFFKPNGIRSPSPLVVAVGRLVPVKRFDVLIKALVEVKKSVPDLKAVIAGEGFERSSLEALRHKAAATDWIDLPGYLSETEIRDLYQRAWALGATSLREGWGMSLTEAGACGTPGVATSIAGHQDAVLDGETGLLATDGDFAIALEKILTDDELRHRLGKGALEHTLQFTWEQTARGTLLALADDAMRRAGGQGHAPH